MTTIPDGQGVRRNVGEPVDAPPVGMIFIRLSKSTKVKNKLRLNKKNLVSKKEKREWKEEEAEKGEEEPS